MVGFNGDPVPVPENIAVCPECGRQVEVEVTEWDEEGKPTAAGCYVGCHNYNTSLEPVEHLFYQLDWAGVEAKAVEYLRGLKP